MDIQFNIILNKTNNTYPSSGAFTVFFLPVLACGIWANRINPVNKQFVCNMVGMTSLFNSSCNAVIFLCYNRKAKQWFIQTFFSVFNSNYHRRELKVKKMTVQSFEQLTPVGKPRQIDVYFVKGNECKYIVKI